MWFGCRHEKGQPCGWPADRIGLRSLGAAVHGEVGDGVEALEPVLG